MSTDQTPFDGWAILEIFGHQKFAGYVKTEYFGTACMFRLDVPPLKERERVTKSGTYVSTEEDSSHWVPPGSTVKLSATVGYSKLLGVGAIYAITPCDEAAALRAVEEIQPRSLMLVSLPPEKALPGIESTEQLCPACGAPADQCGCILGADDEDEDDDHGDPTATF